MYLESIALTRTLPCLAFAVLLIQQKHALEECLPLKADPAFRERKATLEAML